MKKEKKKNKKKIWREIFSLVKWDDVYQDDIDETISIKKYDNKEDLKRVTKKWNRRYLKNSKYPMIISLTISTIALTSLYYFDIIEEGFTIFGFSGFKATIIVFGIFFLPSFIITHFTIVFIYYFTQKKPPVNTTDQTGDYTLEEEK